MTDAQFRALRPMLAMLVPKLPTVQSAYAFEFKWDGMRALARCANGQTSLLTRNGIDATARFPELASLARTLKHDAILDGEIVAMDDENNPSFARLQQRMHVSDPTRARLLAKEVPVHFIVFDVLSLKGKSVIDEPWSVRRALLEKLKLKGVSWELSPAVIGRGEKLFATAQKHQLEGIVAKKLDSVYELGERSPHWLKIKLVQRQEMVVGGWTSERGSPGALGSLLVGYYDSKGGQRKLHFAGGVGTGFNNQTAGTLLKTIKKFETDTSPFAEPVPRGARSSRDIHFTKPKLVIEVEYRRWPVGGMMQQSAFKGTRIDKRAAEVVREDRAGL